MGITSWHGTDGISEDGKSFTSVGRSPHLFPGVLVGSEEDTGGQVTPTTRCLMRGQFFPGESEQLTAKFVDALVVIAVFRRGEQHTLGVFMCNKIIRQRDEQFPCVRDCVS